MFHFLRRNHYSNTRKKECHQTLLKWNEYYRDLSPKMRTEFVARTIFFLRNIRFKSAKEIHLTYKIKVLVVSGFIQITFGLKRSCLVHFKTIYIANKAYSYKSIGVLYHGDTNPKTAQINLVWEIIEKGFRIPDDALNLSIHEFSHALILDNKKRMTFRKFYKHKALILYLLAAKVEMNRMRDGKSSIFRKYGSVNLMEFFAVSVEVFFEQTDRFALNYPLLYERLCLLLQQDPRKKHNPRLYP